MTPFETAQTHQNEFTRGYWLGFAHATTCYWLGAFLIKLPTAFLGDLQEMMEPRSVAVRDTERNQFGVEFARVHIGPAEVPPISTDHIITLVAG